MNVLSTPQRTPYEPSALQYSFSVYAWQLSPSLSTKTVPPGPFKSTHPVSTKPHVPLASSQLQFSSLLQFFDEECEEAQMLSIPSVVVVVFVVFVTVDTVVVEVVVVDDDDVDVVAVVVVDDDVGVVDGVVVGVDVSVGVNVGVVSVGVVDVGVVVWVVVGDVGCGFGSRQAPRNWPPSLFIRPNHLQGAPRFLHCVYHAALLQNFRLPHTVEVVEAVVFFVVVAVVGGSVTPATHRFRSCGEVWYPSRHMPHPLLQPHGNSGWFACSAQAAPHKYEEHGSSLLGMLVSMSSGQSVPARSSSLPTLPPSLHLFFAELQPHAGSWAQVAPQV